MSGTVYVFRKKKTPDPSGAFFVFQFEGSDISNEDWKNDVSSQVCFETRGLGIGEPIFMWRNPIHA